MSDSNIGARKDKNIRNHLFIIYGIINSTLRGEGPSLHLNIYDLVKAFDKLWLDDAFNELYDTVDEEYKDEKLALLYKSNEDNLVAVKTPVGLTKRVNVKKIVQQGGTFGPIVCSNTIDSIGKECERRKEMNFKYKSQVSILPLAMVDDLMSVSKCGLSSVIMSSYINTKIEMKNLLFHKSNKEKKSKCHYMHIGQKDLNCSIPKVHDENMEEVYEDVYLGDLISSDGKNAKNIKARVSKGLGIVSQILNIFKITTFGKHEIEIGLMLRQSMLLNGMLTNGEIWYNVTKNDIRELEKVDLILLRQLLKTPVSTPKESFYLELGIHPIGNILKQRRINYLHYLLTRETNSLLFRFFQAQ